jgi:hypothetical protein
VSSFEKIGFILVYLSMRNRISILAILLSTFCFGQNITVGPNGDFPNLAAAESAMSPGDTVFVMDAIYEDGTQFLTINGMPDEPIVIKAINQHQAIFQGGTESIHLINCSYVIIDGFVIQGQSGNGINIDDGGDYTTPTHHITIQNCIFQDMAANGNNDLLKLSGLNDFTIQQNEFLRGGPGGSGVDMVGCHRGVIQDNTFDDSGVTGIQAKGGTQFILIRRNYFTNLIQRALNLGGSTGLQFFRPPLTNPIVDAFEAADLMVYSNIFVRNWAPIAFVGSVRVKVFNNTFYNPQNWVIRILQETTEPGFLACADNEFRNNIVYLDDDLREVNIGPNTNPESFIFSNNLWYNAMDAGNWLPDLPVTDVDQLITNPLLVDPENGDFTLQENSPAIGSGLMLVEPETDYLASAYANPPSIGAYEGAVSTSNFEEFFNDELRVYPNPTDGLINISAEMAMVEIAVFDLAGRLVYNKKSQNGLIDISYLDAGIYILQIGIGDEVFNRKVVLR